MVGAASSAASSRAGQLSGSPRRARTSPRTASATIRGTGESGSRMTIWARRVASSHRPRSSSHLARCEEVVAPDVEAALERVVEPEVVVAVGQLVGLEAWRPPCESQQRTARMLVEARVLRDAQDSLEPFDEILRRGGEVIDHLQVGLRVD